MIDSIVELKTRQVFEDALSTIEKLIAAGDIQSARDLMTATTSAVEESAKKIIDNTRRNETLEYCRQRVRLLNFPMKMEFKQTKKIRKGTIPFQPDAAPKTKKYEGLSQNGGKIPIPHIEY